MANVKNLEVLIIDADVPFREQVYNFLLAEGYRNIDTAANLADGLEKIRDFSPGTVLLDGNAPAIKTSEYAKQIAELNESVNLILMIRSQDQQVWSDDVGHPERFSYLIKEDFSKSLSFLLHWKDRHRAR